MDEPDLMTVDAEARARLAAILPPMLPLAGDLVPWTPPFELPPEPATDCARCLARRPRRGPCDWCASRLPPEPPSPGDMAARLQVIPRMFRGATWQNLPDLRRESGAPRVACFRADLLRYRAALGAHRRGVLHGPAGSGKTTVAAAWAHHQIALGVDRVRWFDSPTLLRNERGEEKAPPLELASTGGATVVDDVGAELEGAPPGSGLLAQRIGAVSRVIGERFDRQLPTLVTTGFDAAWIARHYGDRIARRIFENAAVIEIGGAS